MVVYSQLCLAELTSDKDMSSREIEGREGGEGSSWAMSRRRRKKNFSSSVTLFLSKGSEEDSRTKNMFEIFI